MIRFPCFCCRTRPLFFIILTRPYSKTLSVICCTYSPITLILPCDLTRRVSCIPTCSLLRRYTLLRIGGFIFIARIWCVLTPYVFIHATDALLSLFKQIAFNGCNYSLLILLLLLHGSPWTLRWCSLVRLLLWILFVISVFVRSGFCVGFICTEYFIIVVVSAHAETERLLDGRRLARVDVGFLRLVWLTRIVEGFFAWRVR